MTTNDVSVGPAGGRARAAAAAVANGLTRPLRQPARMFWLWLVWMLLWGKLSLLAALGGVIVAAAVLAAFPFRPLGAAPRVRPLRALGLIGYLIIDLVPSSIGVAIQMIKFGPATPSAIVAVPLRTRSEVVSTLVANAVSLAPGNSVLEVDHDAGMFYVHTLNPPEAARATADDLQRRVMAAFPDRTGEPAPAGGPAGPGLPGSNGQGGA